MLFEGKPNLPPKERLYDHPFRLFTNTRKPIEPPPVENTSIQLQRSVPDLR